MNTTLFRVLFLFAVAVYELRASGDQRIIAEEAETFLGSEKWAVRDLRNENLSIGKKCHLFVAELLATVGGYVPVHTSGSVIDTEEWSNLEKASLLVKNDCWKRVRKCRRGDVAAWRGHVGIVTRKPTPYVSGETIGASVLLGRVVKSNWAFRSGHRPLYWRYICPWTLY